MNICSRHSAALRCEMHLRVTTSSMVHGHCKTERLHEADRAVTRLLLQGLADAFILLGMPFDSAEAKQLNKEIFEAIYFSALETSCELAKIDGARLLFPLVLGYAGLSKGCGPILLGAVHRNSSVIWVKVRRSAGSLTLHVLAAYLEAQKLLPCLL